VVGVQTVMGVHRDSSGGICHLVPSSKVELPKARSTWSCQVADRPRQASKTAARSMSTRDGAPRRLLVCPAHQQPSGHSAGEVKTNYSMHETACVGLSWFLP
jgi:hypothetical protein